jgi:Tfp pilus assembly protein PilW
MNPSRRSQQGATMLESLVALAMLMIVLVSMFALYRYQMFALTTQNTQLDTQEAGRAVIDLFAREVRQAGADPTYSGTIPAIVQATPSKLQIQFDRNGNGAIDAGESVTYEYSCTETSCAITRLVSGGTKTVFATSAPTGSTSVFTYYDGTGAAIVPGGSGNSLTAAQLASVRRVKFSLTLQQQNPAPANPLMLKASYTTNVDLRNRWLR